MTTVTALTIAVASRPRPTATPIAAVAQMPAAVVRPCTWPLCACLMTAPAPRKPTPATTPLDDPAQVLVGEAGLLRNQHEQGGAERDQHVRAQPGGAVALLALVADQGAEQDRQAEPQHQADPLGGVGQVRELVPQGVDDQLPHRRRLLVVSACVRAGAAGRC